MATHPNLPIVLCSDGYSLTVLKLPTLSLPSLLSNIVFDARKLLGLQSIAPSTSSAFVHSDSTKQTESIDVAASFSESTGMGDTFANSVDTSAIGGYMPALTGVDIGGIHFAGLGSTLEFPAPVGSPDLHFEDAVANLLCAWGLVLTCVPTVITSNSSSLQSSQTDMTNATILLIRSILDVLQIQNDAVVFIDVLFSLLPFDSIAQSHLSTTATLANGILVARLTRFYNTLLPLKQENKMIDYVNIMDNNISEISDLLDSLTAIIENTYSLRPINDGSNCFYSPNFLGNRSRNHLASAIISALAPTCFWLLKVSQRFHQDVNTCEQIVKKQITSAVAENRFQATEMSVLYNKLSECLNSALVTIQYVNTQIRWISSTQTQIGNPITSNFPKKRRKVCVLISKLERYDIQGALLYVHSLVNYSEAVESELVPFKLSKRVKRVILVLCKIMTSFFCEGAPFILIPSYEAILCRTKLSIAVQNDPVMKFWTVDHTLELLIISQFWIEACSFLQKVGDWKKAFLLATVIVRHSRLMRLKKIEYAELKMLSHQLAVENVLHMIGFQFQFSTAAPSNLRLSCLPGLNDSHLQQTSIISFVSDCLRVCAYAKLDGLLLTLVSSLVSEMTHCCKALPLEAPSAIYLPAPPLFCPQPAVPTEVIFVSQFLCIYMYTIHDFVSPCQQPCRYNYMH